MDNNDFITFNDSNIAGLNYEWIFSNNNNDLQLSPYQTSALHQAQKEFIDSLGQGLDYTLQAIEQQEECQEMTTVVQTTTTTTTTTTVPAVPLCSSETFTEEEPKSKKSKHTNKQQETVEEQVVSDTVFNSTNLREWKIEFPQGSSFIGTLIKISICDRKDGSRDLPEEFLYSSVKYDVKIDAEFPSSSKSTYFMAKLECLYAETEQEVLKDRKPILGETVEKAISSNSSGETSYISDGFKVHFMDVSYHHDRRQFKLRITLSSAQDVNEHLLVITSPSFFVMARRSNGVPNTTFTKKPASSSIDYDKKKKKSTKVSKKRNLAERDDKSTSSSPIASTSNDDAISSDSKIDQSLDPIPTNIQTISTASTNSTNNAINNLAINNTPSVLESENVVQFSKTLDVMCSLMQQMTKNEQQSAVALLQKIALHLKPGQKL